MISTEGIKRTRDWPLGDSATEQESFLTGIHYATSRLLLWRRRGVCVLISASTATPSFSSVRICSCSDFLVCRSAGSSGRLVFLFDFSFIVVDVGVWIPQRPRMGLKPRRYPSAVISSLCSHAAAFRIFSSRVEMISESHIDELVSTVSCLQQRVLIKLRLMFFSLLVPQPH